MNIEQINSTEEFEQLTEVRGRISQKDNSPFFITRIKDIDASEIMEANSLFPDTSLEEYLKDLEKKIDTSKQEIKITSFLLLPSTIFEVNDTVNLNINFTTNKVPKSIILTVNDISREILPNGQNYSIVELISNIKNKTSIYISVQAIDEYDNISAPAGGYVNFVHSSYCGLVKMDQTIDSNFLKNIINFRTGNNILSFSTIPQEKLLINSLQFNINGSFQKNETAFIAIPKDDNLGEPIFLIEGLNYVWETSSILLDGVEYTIWRHPQSLEGNDIIISINKKEG